MYFLFNFSSIEDGVWHWWSVCRDLVSVASWPHAAPREPLGQADGTSCWRVCSSGLTAVVYYSRGSPGIQPMANIKAVPGILEQQECGWRSSPMNSASYMGQMPSARCMHAHYQFIQPLNTPCFSSNSLFFFSLKGALSFSFSFLSMNFDNSNFRSMTSYESHAGKRSHVFEASRPLHLFDQQLGCEFCRSESGSEAPWGPPFMPATSRG